MIDSINRQALGGLGEYLSEECKEEYKKENKVYTLTETSLAKNDTQIKVDLSDGKTPLVNIYIDGSEDQSKIYMNDTMTFCNIDNTVIKFNDEREDVIEFETVKEFNEFMEEMEDE